MAPRASIGHFFSDCAILAELGNRMRESRLAQNLTQAQLARGAGVGTRTVQPLEAGGVGTQVSA